ncbi:MAG TPA: 3-deoxy-7-phosphoheptulonate synthase [Phycisphaerae bacterium]|nr:3-deoxy-7-phosphoheptulonate synthase [Phycisphaerae bacterium]HRW54090.1 3-deoxy-7-phosphoheptulonate synthase [Phycisphaerae bacterium]
MLILMHRNATEAQIDAVCRRIEDAGNTANVLPGATRTAVAITGNENGIAPERFLGMPGVIDCVAVTNACRLVSREAHPQRTLVDVRGVTIGDGGLTTIGGPCAVESRDQVFRSAEIVAASGAKLFRGGAFKPRTSPYSFQGLKHEGLKLLDDVKREFDLRIVTEVRDSETLDAVELVADVLQIGARNMQNYSLLEAVGKRRIPVLLKRGAGCTLNELFLAAEYILSLGNKQVILCERGIRTFETMTRNTFDLSAIVMIRHHTHLPVIADPSHGVGIGWAVPPMAKAAVVAGADGVMVEVHPQPWAALSDGQQALTPEAYAQLVKEMNELADWRSKQPTVIPAQ